jgi:hypothetical protein
MTLSKEFILLKFYGAVTAAKIILIKLRLYIPWTNLHVAFLLNCNAMTKVDCMVKYGS